MRGARAIMVVTVACAAALGDVTGAAAQIQLVPPGQPAPRQAAPPPQQGAPQQRRPDTLRPTEQGQQRGARRRGQQQRQPEAATPAADPAAPSPFPQRLDQRTIRARFFNGQPINARALGGGLFTLVFHEDGRMERTSPNGEVRTGRWRFLGDAYCSRWDPVQSAAAAAPAEARQPTGGRQSSRGRQSAPRERPAPEVCHTVVQEGTTIRVVRNTRAVATWAREGTPPPP